MGRRCKKRGGEESSQVSELVEDLFNKKQPEVTTSPLLTTGGKKSKKTNNNGGVAITPFLSALALLGTRIINDKRFINSKGSLFDPFKNKLQKKHRKYARGKTYGGEDGSVSNDISDMMSKVSSLNTGSNQLPPPEKIPAPPAPPADTSAPSADTSAVTALTGGRRSYRKKCRGGDGENDVNNNALEVLMADTKEVKSDGVTSDGVTSGGKGRRRRAASPKRRAASPKRRASPKRK